MKAKTIISLLLAVLLMFGLFGCFGNRIGEDEAKTLVNSFFEAIEAEDYEKADMYLHPERPAPLKEFFEAVGADKSLSFASGIKVEQYTKLSSSLYDSTVKGSTYTLDMQTMVGDAALDIFIEIVRNDNGYGIYNFEIKP